MGLYRTHVLPRLINLAMGSPRIAELLWRDALVTAAIQREWIVSLGQRHALERTGHLLCETFLRLEAAGLASGSICEFPITQAELADATGLSAVHVNRTLQELRSTGLVSLANRTLTIHDMGALMRAALFNPSYLHLGRTTTDPTEPEGPAKRGGTDRD